MNSSLSVALPLQEAIVGALNIYATAPHSFDPDTIELARTFAGYAAVAIANAHLYPITATLADNMRRAMETRAVIEQAKGIVIAQQHCTPDTWPAPAARPCTARWRTKQRTRQTGNFPPNQTLLEYACGPVPAGTPVSSSPSRETAVTDQLIG